MSPQAMRHSRHFDPYSCNMDAATPTFGELIATARRARNWSQEDLERESGVSRGSISRWERGIADRPEPENVRAVCRALGIDPRRAAVALGYLTADEVDPSRLDPEVEEILQLLPRMTPADRQTAVDYLRFLRDRQNKPEQDAV